MSTTPFRSAVVRAAGSGPRFPLLPVVDAPGTERARSAARLDG